MNFVNYDNYNNGLFKALKNRVLFYLAFIN